MSKIVLWVSDLTAQADFYGKLLGAQVISSTDAFAELTDRTNTVLLHVLPAEYREATPLKAELPPQEEVAIKPVFSVASIAEARSAVGDTFARFGGAPATYGDYSYLDLVDPEGNVIQLQQSVKTKGLFDDELFAITLVAHDLAASIDFYGAKLGAKQVFSDEVSAVFVCGKTMINVLSGAAAVELVEPASVVSDGSGVGAVYTLRVADVDAAAAQLEAAGASLLNGPIDRPWGVRTASFQDPSGHTWELADH
jgi:catechol 2,3-dioxygenase-like lactoylglutathione lyase family enzyme